jgi:hypothetical protein
MGNEKSNEKKPKHTINFEGTDYDWHKDTITPPEIRTLVGITDNQPILIIDFKDNSERELRENEAVDVKPGNGFSRKIGFKRG